MFIVPAYKENNQVTRGRGKSGLVTMWKKGLTKYVSKVSCSNFRIQATKFKFPAGPVLVINSYFPCDPRTDNFDDSELITLLADLRSVIQSSECNNVLLAGDLNSHFDRQSRFTNLVDNELADLGLVLLWQNTDNNPHHWIQPVDYTYLSVSNNVASCSTIDHFGASHRMYTAVKEAGVIHSGENLSNHSAIYLKIRLGDIELSMDEPRKERMVSWQRASDDDKDNFKYVMQEKFQNLNLPACASCQDLACTIHTDEMEEYTMTVLEAVECKQGVPPIYWWWWRWKG